MSTRGPRLTLAEHAHDTVDVAVAAIRAGGAVVVVDDAERENEGDVVVAAELATPESVAFMMSEARGLICAPMAPELVDALELPQMVARNSDPHATAFTVSVDARLGVSTGISAADRARTLRLLADPTASPDDLTRPGHVFPLRARSGGVVDRRGHTEAAVDLARLAGLAPAAAICEIAKPDGTMARRPDLLRFADINGLPILAIADLVAHRSRHEVTVRRAAVAALPIATGPYSVTGYLDERTGIEHVALVRGNPAGRPVPAHVHLECPLGDIFGSLACACRQRLDAALRTIDAAGAGVLVYLRGSAGGRPAATGRPVLACPRAGGADPAETMRVGRQILRDLGVDDIDPVPADLPLAPPRPQLSRAPELVERCS